MASTAAAASRRRGTATVTEAFIRHRTAANLLMLLFLAAGTFSLGRLNRETFPDFLPNEVEVRVVYPGATPAEVEEVICLRIEEALDGVRFVRQLRTEARRGVALAVVEMVEGAKTMSFKDEIETEIRAIDDFPSDVELPVILWRHTRDPVFSILVAGPMTDRDLKAHCRQIQQQVQRLPEAPRVRIEGFADHQLRVELSPLALRPLGLSVADVADAIRQQNIDLPAGSIETQDSEIVLRFVEQRRTIDQLADLVIRAEPEGAEIRLGDLGRITDRFEHEEELIRLDGRRAALLRVEKTADQDLLRIADRVRGVLDRQRQMYPQVDLVITQDLSALVQDRLSMLVKNGWQGLTLVFLVMWLFFNIRLSFWVTMSLPVSFMAAFCLLPWLGLTINMVSLVGLLLAIGLLMDDGIVIAENIATHFARGTPAWRAAIDGVLEVRAGVLSSFTTTVCVLGPLTIIEGSIGKVLRVFPMVLILVLTVSLIEALLILPAHLAHSHRSDASPAPFRRRFDRGMAWVQENLLGRAVDAMLRWRYLTIGMAGGVLLASLGLVAGGIVQFEAFRDLDGDTISARLLLPSGTPLDRTEAVVEEMLEQLDVVNQQFAPQQPGGQDLVRSAYVRFNENLDAFEQGPHMATIYVDLLTADQRHAPLDDVMQSWRQAVGQPADVVNLVYAQPALGPAGRNLEIRLQGDDITRLQVAAEELRRYLGTISGVRDVIDDVRLGPQELHVSLRPGTLGLGLDAHNIARQLRSAYHHAIADELQIGMESYTIAVQLASPYRDSLADLESFHVTLPDGNQIPLAAVATIEPTRSWARIARYDRRRCVSVLGDVDSRVANTAAVVAQIRQQFLPRLGQHYPDVEVLFEGEIREVNVARRSMRQAMLIGLIGVYLLLSFQFRSYLEPLIVMAAIPLALVGVIWGHWLMGLDLSMPSVIGFISLSGVVVNNSLLLVLFLKRERQAGNTVVRAAALASRRRFRAILITSTTTIAGLLPLLTERSLQAQVLIPLAVSLAFGLLSSAVLVLGIIPCLYAALDDLGAAKLD